MKCPKNKKFKKKTTGFKLCNFKLFQSEVLGFVFMQ